MQRGGTSVAAEDTIAPRLTAMCELLTAAPEPESTTQRVVERLVCEGTADAVGLHVVTELTLTLVAHHGFSRKWEEFAHSLQLADSRFGSVQAILSEEPVQVRRIGASRCPGTGNAAGSEPAGTYLFIPIRSRGKIVGAMGVLRQTDEPLGLISIQYLKAIAALCGTCPGVLDGHD